MESVQGFVVPELYVHDYDGDLICQDAFSYR
jgi:hypothetical protein